jgi:hypothetical protein
MYSDLLYVPTSAAAVSIDWTRVPEASKKYFLDVGWAYDWETNMHRPLPATVGELAKMFDQKKFFAYYQPELCTLLMDISEFGLQVAPGTGMEAGPRFYMTFLNEVWYLLFMPGIRDCISGYSEKVVRRTYDGDDEDEEPIFDDAEDERVEAEKMAMAQKFDIKLEHEVKRGADIIVPVSHKLAGWDATMMQSDLEYSKYATAILTLPREHPERVALTKNATRSLIQ